MGRNKKAPGIGKNLRDGGARSRQRAKPSHKRKEVDGCPVSFVHGLPHQTGKVDISPQELMARIGAAARRKKLPAIVTKEDL